MPKYSLSKTKLGVYATFFAALGVSLPSFSQSSVIKQETIAGYDIGRVSTKGVCFAASSLTSQKGHAMLYTYYQTVAGQRWNVIGYSDDAQKSDGTMEVSTHIDGVETLNRRTIQQNGDVMIPFERLEEITAHEKLLLSGNKLTITFQDVQDSATIDLTQYRQAFGAVQNCLKTFKDSSGE